MAQIRRFSRAKVNAILLNMGLIRQFADSPQSKPLPGIIARIDWTNIWTGLNQDHATQLRSCLLARPEEALRHGADAVLTYMVVGTGDADFESKEIARTAKVARECEQLGIPLMVETLARGRGVEAPGDPLWLNLHTRMALELGADIIKTDYSGDPRSMRSVVDACSIPILVLGGSRQGSDEAALDLARGAVASGAAGVFFGRNVFQSSDMETFLERIRVVLDGNEVLQGERT